MATTKKATAGYQVQITIDRLMAYVDIAGQSLEDAIANGRELDLKDVLSIDMAGIIDGEVRVTGVTEK